MPAALSSGANEPINVSTFARPSASRKIGTMTTWICATIGGTIRPESSPCAMTRAPMRRVLMPHDVEGHRGDVAGESLGWRLLAEQHRDRQPVLGDRAVVAEDELDLVHRLLRGRVKRVTLLPPELA